MFKHRSVNANNSKLLNGIMSYVCHQSVSVIKFICIVRSLITLSHLIYLEAHLLIVTIQLMESLFPLPLSELGMRAAASTVILN
jgi:hypothetical protein